MAVGDWVPCVAYGVQQLAALDPADLAIARLDVLLVYPSDGLGVAGEVGVVEVEDEVMSKRSVGWVAHRIGTVEELAIVVHERIRVCMQADDGTQLFFATDLESGSDANEPFLWERVSIVESFAGGFPLTWPSPVVGTKDYSIIDVGVTRKLRRGDALVYSVQWSAINGEFDPGDVLSTFVWLRTWARVRG